MKKKKKKRNECLIWVLSLTDVTDKLVDVRFLQKAQLAHAREGVEGLVDDKLLGVAQALLQQRLQDGGALPAHVGRYA